MWNRSELKSNAKLALKANYWKAVLVGLILSFILGSGSTAAQNSARSSTDGLTDIDPVMVFTVIGIILAAVFVAMVISILLSIFIWNPLEVGCQKFFINCKYGNAELGDIAYGFKKRICAHRHDHVPAGAVYRTLDVIIYHSGYREKL